MAYRKISIDEWLDRAEEHISKANSVELGDPRPNYKTTFKNRVRKQMSQASTILCKYDPRFGKKLSDKQRERVNQLNGEVDTIFDRWFNHATKEW